MASSTVELEGSHEAVSLCGKQDENLKLVEQEMDIKILARGTKLVLTGGPVALRQAERLFEELLAMVRKGEPLRREEVRYALGAIREDEKVPLAEALLDRIQVPSRRRYVRPRTLGQKRYLEAIRHHDMVFGIGPAGTGKTYLAMAMAVSALMKKQVSRIILTRPAIEAGEKLGFLPGDLLAKVDPYLRPLYDALYDMMEMDRVQRAIENGAIEVAPLGYMRGRTLNDSFIILDEAQNSTSDQMKMFLTRLGFDSKTVITGDITQVDLPEGRTSGLIEVQGLLEGIPGISFVYFDGRDVVRHELVQEIVRAYEKKKVQQAERKEQRG